MESIVRGHSTLGKLILLRRKTQNPVCVVQDQSDSFNYVELDINLEQSIQRASKSQGGIVDQTRMFAVVVEFELSPMRSSSHRRTAVRSQMSGLWSIIRPSYTWSIKAVIFYANISRLLDFVQAVAKPVIIKASGVRKKNKYLCAYC